MDDQLIADVDLGSGPFERATADWLNLQLYVLWLDTQRQLHRGESVSMPVWHGNFLRDSGAVGQLDITARDERVDHAMAAIQTVEVDFADYLVVAQRLSPGPVGALLADDPEATQYAEFSTRFFDVRTGEELGILHWFSESRVLLWDYPGVTAGRVSDDVIPGDIPFTPNLAWSAIQALAFWTFRPLLMGDLFSGSCTETRTRSGNDGAVGPTHNNQIGCDWLHWLDDTILRPCCDDHDLCYAKRACTWKSWFFLDGWKCTKCNIAVVWCFVTGGGGDDECCTRDMDGFCAPECSWCC